MSLSIKNNLIKVKDNSVIVQFEGHIYLVNEKLNMNQ